ncbi:MAG TPA: hypothetical protein VEV41_27935 [Terriglobales bacterium]|nr:hypothetical protein [Terriglobales bacterium]
MRHKIVKMSYWLVPILLVCLYPLALQAQYGATQEKQEDKAEKKAEKKGHSAQTITGCLQKGDEPNEFTITDEDGKTWGLRSSKVNLGEHVGHKVTVAGSPAHESKSEEKKEKAEEKKEGKMEKAAEKQEYGDLQVSSLKMVSDSCSK